MRSGAADRHCVLVVTCPIVRMLLLLLLLLLRGVR
jgi:hypothetical protein